MLVLIGSSDRGFGLFEDQVSDDGRLGLSQPPWLVAQDGFVSRWTPSREFDSDGRGGRFSLVDSDNSTGAEPVTEPLQVPQPWAPMGATPEVGREVSGWAQDGWEHAEVAPEALGAREPDFRAHHNRGDVTQDDVDRVEAAPADVPAGLSEDTSPITPGECVGSEAFLAPAVHRMLVPPPMIASSAAPVNSGHASIEADDLVAGRSGDHLTNNAAGPSPPDLGGPGFASRVAPSQPPWPSTGGPPLDAAGPPEWLGAPGQPLRPPGPPGVIAPGSGAFGASHRQLPSPPTHDYMPQHLQAFGMPPSLDEVRVVDRRRYAPQSGWRRAVHRATGGYVNVGDSRKQRRHQDLLSVIGRPIAGDFRIAVLSIKGGVGKTTTTLGLGSSLAMVRRDRVIAVDANPDRGTLAERVGDVSTCSTVRDLLNSPAIDRYADIRCHTRMTASRLEVLASEQEPGAAEVFDEADYRRTVDILGRHYNVILTDCGTGIMHSAMAGVLALAHSIVLVSSPAIDAVRSASATLDWLVQHGYSTLVREGHVVLSASRPGSAGLKLDKVYEFFGARCQSIHFVPFDPHLAEGTDVDVALLKPATRQAYLDLAGAVAQNFSVLHAVGQR